MFEIIQENGITEIILVDGNSVDRTKDIAKNLLTKYIMILKRFSDS